MKKDKRILALVLAAAMMGTTALPVWAQTPETADSSMVEVEGTLENIIAAREALAARPATLAEYDNNMQAAQTTRVFQRMQRCCGRGVGGAAMRGSHTAQREEAASHSLAA